MIIFCNYLNLIFKLCQINISGKCYGVSNQNMTFCYETGRWFHTCPHMRTPGLKACLLRILGDNKLIKKLYFIILWNIIYYENLVNYYSHDYTSFFITCCPKNTLICKLDLVYRYIVYNKKTRLWPFYTHFIERKRLSNHSVITVENHLLYKAW